MPELILALDVTEKKRALEIAHACATHLDAIKIGYPLVLSAGLSIAGDLNKAGLPLIADFKVADIPNTNQLICDQVFAAGFSAIICHGFPGMDSVKACVASARVHKGQCYVVAEMSHPGGKEFFSQGTAEQIAANAVIAGADGIIAPATRPGPCAGPPRVCRPQKDPLPGDRGAGRGRRRGRCTRGRHHRGPVHLRSP